MGLFSSGDVESEHDKLDVGAISSMHRIVDKEAGVVIYANQSGNTAVPISETELSLDDQDS